MPATLETYVETSSICLALSESLKAGIGPPPFSTWCLTAREVRLQLVEVRADVAGRAWRPSGCGSSTQPALVKTALPAVASPVAGGGAGVVASTVPDGVDAVGVVPVPASFFSLPKTSDGAEHRDQEQHPEQRRTSRRRDPGKFGFRRGSTSDEISAKRMNAPPTEARPIFWPVVSPATTSDVDSIAAGTYPNYVVAVSAAAGGRR